jgi:hypothetical protein
MDQDLSTDDLKLVRYRVVLTKRDSEHLICHGEMLVNYKTTAPDFGGLVTAECLQKHPLKHPDDNKYIRTSIEVIARYPKQDKEYDKEQVEVLREIKDKI